jgi:hypothetical protein
VRWYCLITWLAPWFSSPIGLKYHLKLARCFKSLDNFVQVLLAQGLDSGSHYPTPYLCDSPCTIQPISGLRILNQYPSRATFSFFAHPSTWLRLNTGAIKSSPPYLSLCHSYGTNSKFEYVLSEDFSVVESFEINRTRQSHRRSTVDWGLAVIRNFSTAVLIRGSDQSSGYNQSRAKEQSFWCKDRSLLKFLAEQFLMHILWNSSLCSSILRN